MYFPRISIEARVIHHTQFPIRKQLKTLRTSKVGIMGQNPQTFLPAGRSHETFTNGARNDSFT